MPAIGFVFVLFLAVQALLASVAYRLARERDDEAILLAALVFAGGVVGALVLGEILRVVVVEALCLGLYALVSNPRSPRRRPSRR